jgi:integrase
VSRELVPASVHQALTTVTGLQRGRTSARESDAVRPAEDCDVDAALPFLAPAVADMVRLQRLTGCRPGEIRILRPVDIDRSVDPWIYRPESHKTEHHGHGRTIFFGPMAKEILLPYLLRNAESYCFSPADSERHRKAEMRDARKTKVQPSQVDRSKSNPRRFAGECYSKDSYARAIARACDAADRQAHKDNPVVAADDRLVQSWTPNQLRHAAATKIRREFGLEAAQVILGHSRADVTQVYAERDMERAANVMKEIGRLVSYPARSNAGRRVAGQPVNSSDRVAAVHPLTINRRQVFITCFPVGGWLARQKQVNHGFA